MKRIKRFGVYQTSKVSAIIMFLISLVIVVPLALIGSIAGNNIAGFPSGGFILALPFIYGIMGFIMTAISCAVYNAIAKRAGGIEIEFEVVDESNGEALDANLA